LIGTAGPCCTARFETRFLISVGDGRFIWRLLASDFGRDKHY
jgi:hypothetical protein